MAKITPLKYTKNLPKIWHFLKKNFGKKCSVIFKNFQPKFLRIWSKMAFYMIFANKKKISQIGKSGSVRPVKQSLLFCGLNYKYMQKNQILPMKNESALTGLWKLLNIPLILIACIEEINFRYELCNVKDFIRRMVLFQIMCREISWGNLCGEKTNNQLHCLWFLKLKVMYKFSYIGLSQTWCNSN